MEKEKRTDYLDKLLDFILTKSNAKYLTIIVTLGAILRYIVVKNISFLGDEMVHGPHAINIWGSGLISTLVESPTWFYLTDIAHKIFGVTIFSARFLSFFYGTLTILLIYLLAKQVFNKKVALLSAAFLSVSAYHIRYSLIEMDISLTFFLLFAAYTFIKYFKENKTYYLYLTGLLLGTGVLIKTITAFFVPIFILFYFILGKRDLSKENLKKYVIFGLIMLMFLTPIIIHNILLYKEKGVVDVYVAQYFNINREVYSGQLGYNKSFNITQLWTGSLDIGKVFLSLDPIIFILGLIGMAYSIKKAKSKESAFLISLVLFGYLALIISNLLPTHYVTFIPFLAIYASFSLVKLSEKPLIQKYGVKFLVVCFILLLVANIFLIPGKLLSHVTSQTANAKMREFAISDIEKDALVIADARIYRGRIAWLFHDRHYVESAYFPLLLEESRKIPQDQLVPTKTYFIECARDDCGWGTIKAGELNDTNEALISEFKKISGPIAEFKGGGGYDEEKNQPYFNVYRGLVALHPESLQFADQTHEWFYYPIGYEPKEKIWDNYATTTFFAKFFHSFGFLILYISILIGILAPIYLLYELKKN